MADRRLVLVRHAQAGEAADDRERPLTGRGQQQAAAVGRRLAELGVAPDRVVVSPALRTRQTWARIAEALDGPPEPDVEERVYANTLDGLYEVLRESGEEVRTVVLVGHNPAVGHLAHDSDDGEGDPAARDALGHGFPPASVAVLEVDTPFAVLGPSGAALVAVLPPPA